MKTKLTTTFAVVVVALVVFGASGSTTYSWFSDSDHSSITITMAVNIVLEEDSNEEIVIDESQYGKVDLNYHIVSNKLTNHGTMSVNDGTIKVKGRGLDNFGVATITDVTMEVGSPGAYGCVSEKGSYTVYDNVTITSAGGGIGVADGAKSVFNSGSVAVNSTSTSGRYVFYVVGEGSELTINDGDFSFSKTLNQKRAYVHVGEGATVNIMGGTFGKASSRSGYTAGLLGSGTIIITGGTFGFDPSNWVADGYEAVKNGENWTVSKK